MNCRRAKSDIALWIGNDLDDLAARKLQRHVSACPRCRDYWQSMTRSIETLQSPVLQPRSQSSPGLWPDLSPRLPHPDHPDQVARFNGWVPALATLAACLAILIFSRDLSTSSPHQPPRAAPIQTTPVGAPHWGEPRRSSWPGQWDVRQQPIGPSNAPQQRRQPYRGDRTTGSDRLRSPSVPSVNEGMAAPQRGPFPE